MPPESRKTATDRLDGWSASHRVRAAAASAGSAHSSVRSTWSGRDRLTDHQDVLDGVRSGAELLGHLGVVESAQRGRHRERRGLAVRGQVAQLVLAVRGQGHDRHDPGAQARQGQDDELPAVGQLDDDAVIPLQSEVVDQAGGQRVGPGGQRAVGEPHVPVDECDGVGVRVGDGHEFGAQRRSSPPPPLDVAPRDLLGPRDDPRGGRGGGTDAGHGRASLPRVSTASSASSPSAVTRSGLISTSSISGWATSRSPRAARTRPRAGAVGDRSAAESGQEGAAGQSVGERTAVLHAQRGGGHRDIGQRLGDHAAQADQHDRPEDGVPGGAHDEVDARRAPSTPRGTVRPRSPRARRGRRRERRRRGRPGARRPRRTCG